MYMYACTTKVLAVLFECLPNVDSLFMRFSFPSQVPLPWVGASSHSQKPLIYSEKLKRSAFCHGIGARVCMWKYNCCRYVACAYVQEWEYIGTKSLISIALFFRNNFLVPETRARGVRGRCFFQYIQSAHVYSQKSQTLKLSPAWCDAEGALVSVYLCIWARFSE